MEPVVNERAVLVARRNDLMSQLLRIAPSVNPPQPESVRQPATHAPKQTMKREAVEKKTVTKPKPVEIPKLVARKTEDVFADNPQIHTVNGVHMDIYDYFCTNPEKVSNEQLDRLSFIYAWVLKSGKTLREGLLKLNRLDLKLGSADDGEAKILKLYNYLRLRYGNA